MKLLNLLKCRMSLLENNVLVLLILGRQVTIREFAVDFFFVSNENALVSILAAKSC